MYPHLILRSTVRSSRNTSYEVIRTSNLQVLPAEVEEEEGLLGPDDVSDEDDGDLGF